MKILTSTNTGLTSTAILFLRLMTGLILFVGGAGKVLGWFGGLGMEAMIGYFKIEGFPAYMTYISSYAEFLGGLLIMLGLFTRPAAFALVINMLVATIVTGIDNFFMGGAAYPCLLMVCNLSILLAGPMYFSLDYLLFHRKINRNEPASYN
jgi:putative oxidoreductase